MRARKPLVLLRFFAGLAAGLGDAEDYVKVVNGRCVEFEDVYPIGQVGHNWTSDLDDLARNWCDRRSWCVGFMRYVAEDHDEHCNEWCGRPQFCKDSSLSPSDEWVSYLQKSSLRRWQEAQAESERDKDAHIPMMRVALYISGTKCHLRSPMTSSEDFRSVVCFT